MVFSLNFFIYFLFYKILNINFLYLYNLKENNTFK